MKMRRIMLCVLVAAMLWTIQIIKINRTYDVEETIYSMGEPFEWNGVQVTCTEAHIYSREEYAARMGIEAEISEPENEYLCMKVELRNLSEKNLSWDTVLDNFGYGFQSDVWCSVSLPYLGAKLNCFSSEVFESGTTQDVWFVTMIDEVCFKKQNWNRVSEMEYSYVLSVYPKPIEIRLGLS